EEVTEVQALACEPGARAVHAQACGAHVGDGDGHVLAHFLPLFFLIGSAERSPYHTTFAPRSSTAPKTTGIGRPSSAVGASRSESSAGFGVGGLGARATETSTVTTMTARNHGFMQSISLEDARRERVLRRDEGEAAVVGEVVNARGAGGHAVIAARYQLYLGADFDGNRVEQFHAFGR